MTTDMNGKKMTTADMVKAFIAGLKKDKLTILIGDTKVVYILNRLFPKLTFNLANPKKSYKVIAS